MLARAEETYPRSKELSSACFCGLGAVSRPLLPHTLIKEVPDEDGRSQGLCPCLAAAAGKAFEQHLGSGESANVMTLSRDRLWLATRWSAARQRPFVHRSSVAPQFSTS